MDRMTEINSPQLRSVRNVPQHLDFATALHKQTTIRFVLPDLRCSIAPRSTARITPTHDSLNHLKPRDYFTYHQFNTQKFYMVIALHLCVLCGSQNKQRLLPSTTSADWFCILQVESVCCAVRTESLYETHTFRP